MKKWAYYNDADAVACEVTREMIRRGIICDGEVDSRSIKEVQPEDVSPFTQAHFFCGGSLWSVSARLAGWPDDKPLWSASCPCQPFSQAGQKRGFADERHLWPDFFRLVRARRPAVIVGEQVAGKAGYAWFDGVAADLGAEGYARRVVDIPAAAVDAPNIRQRQYWIAVADAEHIDGRAGSGGQCDRQEPSNLHRLHADTHGGAIEQGLERQPRHGDAEAGRSLAHRSVAEADGGRDLADANQSFGRIGDEQPAGQQPLDEPDFGTRLRPGARNGSFWSDHEWIICHDGKARRTQSGIRLLVDGFPGRVDLWRIAGNAINPQLAAEVLAAFLETENSVSAAA